GNLCSMANGNADNGRIVTALRSAGAGILQGQTNVAVADGRAVFTNLYHTVATNITVGFNSGSLLGTTSVVITIAPGQATQLLFDSAGSKQLSASADGLGSTVSSLFTVAKGNQTITFSSLGNKNYGDPAFHVSAVASSGLPVTFTILSGPASLSGDLVTVI